MEAGREFALWDDRGMALEGMNLPEVRAWAAGCGNETGDEFSWEADVRIHVLEMDVRRRREANVPIPEVRLWSSPGGARIAMDRRQGAQFTGNWTSGDGVTFPAIQLKYDYMGLRFDESQWPINFLIGNFAGFYPVAHSVKYIMGYSRVGDAMRRVRAIESFMRIPYNWGRLSKNDEGWFKTGQLVSSVLLAVPGLMIGRWPQPRSIQQARNMLVFWLEKALQHCGSSNAPERTPELMERAVAEEQEPDSEEGRLSSEVEEEDEDDTSSEGAWSE